MVDYTYRPTYEYEIQVAFAQDKTLVCVYDSEYWDNGLLILYDTQAGKSWPGWGPSDEHWRVPYAQLRDENPSLPAVSYLMIDDE